MSEIIGNIILKQLVDGHYEALTKTEKEFVRLKKIEQETEMLKYIRSKNAEKINFLKNIKKQIFMFAQLRDNDKKDIIKNMKINLQIAQANNWKNETTKIKGFLQKVKEQDYAIDVKEPQKRIEDKTK